LAEENCQAESVAESKGSSARTPRPFYVFLCIM